MFKALIKKYRDYDKGQRVALVLITVFLLSSFSLHIADSFKLGNALHSGSSLIKSAEANAYRAAMNYHRNGFLSNAGLPLVMGPEWQLSGKTRSYILTERKLPATPDTNNPPGHYLLLGLLVKIFGPGRMQIYRLLPISLGIAAVFLSALLLLSCGFDPLGVVLYTFATIIVPAFSNYLPVLHYISYASSLFLLSLAIYLRYLKKPDSVKNRRYHQLFFLIGFLQGCLSFEWFFMAVFFPVPLWFFMKHFHKPLDRRTLIKPVLYLFTGFFIAHFLHLLEVAVYYGDLGKAVSIMLRLGHRRSVGNPNHVILPPYLLDNLYSSTAQYYQQLRSSHKLFKFDLLSFSALTLLVIKKVKTVFGQTVTVTVMGHKIELFDPVINRNTLWMFTSAFIISAGWFLVMREHATVHLFTKRHFLLLYLIMGMYLTFILAPRKELLILLFIITLPITSSHLYFPFSRTLKYYYQTFPSRIIRFSKQRYENRYRPLYGSAILFDDYKIWKTAEETYIIKIFFTTHHTIDEDYSLEIEVIDPANPQEKQSAFYSQKDYPVQGVPTSNWQPGATRILARAFYAKSDRVELRISWTAAGKKKKPKPLWYKSKQVETVILNTRLPQKSSGYRDYILREAINRDFSGEQ